MDEPQGPGEPGDDLVAALIVERDLWRQRATDCERRWEEFLALEAERAELRRQASESLTLARLNLRAERDEWQRRATAAEARLTGPPPDQDCAEQDRTDDARIAALQAERDEWRERAVRAEASRPSDTPDEPPSEDEREPPAKRPRGNWLG